MKIIWKVNEYMGNGKVRSASFSTHEKALQAACDCCNHSNEVNIVEWTYCRTLSIEQVYPTKKQPEVYSSNSVYA